MVVFRSDLLVFRHEAVDEDLRCILPAGDAVVGFQIRLAKCDTLFYHFLYPPMSPRLSAFCSVPISAVSVKSARRF